MNPLLVATYWSGQLRPVMDAHFRTIIREVANAGGIYRLYLDPQYNRFPRPLEGTDFAWLEREPAFEVVPWVLEEALARHGFPIRTSFKWRVADFLLRALNVVLHPQGLARFSPIQNILKRFKAFDSSQGFELGLSRGPISIVRSKPHASDFFRLDIASQNPEVNFLYLDADVAICKPFAEWPFESSFVYEWPHERFANSAVLFMKRGDLKSREGAIALAKSSDSFRPWKVFPFESCTTLGLEVLPMRWFDLPFSPDNSFSFAPERFFAFDARSDELVDEIRKNSFAFHWHNQWDSALEDGSPAHLLARSWSQVNSQCLESDESISKAADEHNAKEEE